MQLRVLAVDNQFYTAPSAQTEGILSPLAKNRISINTHRWTYIMPSLSTPPLWTTRLSKTLLFNGPHFRFTNFVFESKLVILLTIFENCPILSLGILDLNLLLSSPSDNPSGGISARISFSEGRAAGKGAAIPAAGEILPFGVAAGLPARDPVGLPFRDPPPIRSMILCALVPLSVASESLPDPGFSADTFRRGFWPPGRVVRGAREV